MDNIAGLLAARLATPARVLYRQFVDGAWREFTAADVAQRAARWQAAFRREGLRPGDRIAIGLRNGVAWVALDLAALAARLVVVPLYVDDNADSQAYCASRQRCAARRRRDPAHGRCARPRRRRRRADPLPAAGGGRGPAPGRGLPAARRAGVRGGAGGDGHARDDLLHLGDRGAADGSHALARQHPRQCCGLPRDRHGA